MRVVVVGVVGWYCPRLRSGGYERTIYLLPLANTRAVSALWRSQVALVVVFLVLLVLVLLVQCSVTHIMPLGSSVTRRLH